MSELYKTKTIKIQLWENYCQFEILGIFTNNSNFETENIPNNPQFKSSEKKIHEKLLSILLICYYL